MELLRGYRPRARGAVVLAGGRSRRMGLAKPWLDVGGKPLLTVVTGAVRVHCTFVVVVGRAGEPLPPLPADVVRVDDPPDRTSGGPLAGLTVGLDALRAAGIDVAYCSSCDAALVSPEHVAFMLAALEAADPSPALLPVADGPNGPRPAPLASAVRVAPALAAARRLLATGERRLLSLFDDLRAQRLPARRLPDPDVLLPCNTPREWQEVQNRLLRRTAP